MRTAWIVLLALPLAAQPPAPEPAAAQSPAPAGPAAESWITGDIDLGYRWTGGRGGDLNTYRSVVNLGDGPKLFGVNLSLRPPSSRWVDRIDIRANSWGGDPYNTARLDASREGLYRFTWDYRNIAYFNFLPSFADPGRDRNLFLNQRAYDTFLRSNDFEFTLFPGKRIVPYVAYNRSSGRGSGLTNFVVTSNEYTVPDRIDNHSDVFRAGVRFEMSRYHLTLEQGFMNFDDNQQVASASPASSFGNLTNPVFGQRLFLTTGTQSYQVSGGGVFTKAQFTANPVSWADLYAQFLYSQPHTDTRFTQAGTGNFFDSTTLAFYNGLTSAADARARQPHPSGSAAVELRPFRRLRILESWSTDRLHNAGSAVVLDQLLTTGQSPTASTLAEAERLVVNYNQQELNVLFDITSRITLRGGHRYVWGDAQAPAGFILGTEAAELGKLRRNVGLAGLVYRSAQKLRISLEYEGSPGDRSYFRTSLNEYQRARLQARYQVLPSLSLNAHFGALSNRNPQTGVDFHFLSRDNSLSANWTPNGGKRLTLLAEYSRTSLGSDIVYRNPGTGTPGLSDYHERAHTGTLMAAIPLPIPGSVQPKLDLGGSFFVSDGTSPTRYYQPFGRVMVPFGKHAQGYGEWRWYALSQSAYLYEGFRSHQFTLGLRLTK